MVSAGEKRVLAILSIAYGFLESDDYQESGFINKRITRLIKEIRESLFELLKEYEAEAVNIKKTTDIFLRKISFKNKDYVITNTQVAMDLIYLGLEPTERRFKKLSPKVSQWYYQYRDRVLEVSYKAAETKKYECTDVDSYDLTQFILDEVCK